MYAALEMLRQGHRIRHFAIESLIGEGGTSKVFSATDTRDGLQVALKVLREDHLGDAEVVFRFLNEALPASLRSLRHAALMEVYETSTPGFLPMYHAVERLRGSLAQRLASGPLSVQLSLRLAGQVSDALAVLHAHGIVHRDVKPANLLLSDQPDDRLHAKLCDFGLARLPDGDKEVMPITTAEGTRLGTSDYMPPEQWEDAKTVGGTADVYSLGCSLYEMIAGHRPFPTGTDGQLRRWHLLAEPDALPKAIPAAVRALVAEMMAKSARRRPSAHEVAARISALLKAPA